MFSHPHITMNPAGAEQSLPDTHMWFMGHCLHHILSPVDGQHSQEGWLCRCNVPILQKPCKLWLLKQKCTSLHPPNLHGCKLTEDKQKWYHLPVHLHTWSQFFMSDTAYMSTRLHPTKTSASQTFWILSVHEPACLPSSRVPKLAHALSIRTKVNLSGVLVPLCFISWKSSTVFSCCPALTYLASFLFHEKLSNCAVPGAMEANFTPTHGGLYRSWSQSPSCISLCLIQISCIHLLWSTIPPLQRIWKELPPMGFSLTCCNCSCSKLSTHSQF